MCKGLIGAVGEERSWRPRLGEPVGGARSWEAAGKDFLPEKEHLATERSAAVFSESSGMKT